MINPVKEIITYIENNLFKQIEVKALAKKFSYSVSGIRLLFKSNFNMPINEYITKRRLTKIAFIIKFEKLSNARCADLLFYKNVESFCRAFKNFHNATPSQVRLGSSFNCLNSLNAKIIIEGGDIMTFTLKKMDKIILTGYKTRMKGDVLLRFEQEADFFENTRSNQELLYSKSNIFLNEKRFYTITTNVTDTEFDFYIAYDLQGECPIGFELVELPAGEYYNFETKKCKKPTAHLNAVWQNIKNEIPNVKTPIIEIYHWYLPDSKNAGKRYIETLFSV